MLESLILARMQFAANITFHILFPTITIALGWFLLYIKHQFGKTQDQMWMKIYRFWVKIFALSFALGVVSGVTMSFQFGTNWPGFMEKVGNVAGPLLAYEVMTAFFLEATFLGIMLFGEKRVSNKIHTLATFLVAAGTTFSAFWILVLNSWMQTPAGFEIINGKAHVTSWMAVIFNPSFPYRFIHMLLASGLTVAFLVAGVSAYRWLKNDKSCANTMSMKLGVYLGAILIPIQIMVGDMHGLNTLEHQPAKLAAMEGIWKTQKGVDAVLFAIPDQKNKTNHMEVAIPKLASLYLTHSIDGKVKGLDQFEGNHPPVAPVFYAFRIMVGVGVLMLMVAWWNSWKFFKNKPITKTSARVLLSMTFAGWIAVIAGWYTTEIGRQPWLVYGVLKTSEAASKIAPNIVLGSFLTYIALYVFLLIAYISTIFYMAKKYAHKDSEGVAQ